MTAHVLDATLADLEARAWKALARYDYAAFGSLAAKWSTLNNTRPPLEREPTPFRELVRMAQAKHAIQLRKGDQQT